MGVLMTRALLFGVHIRAFDCWKLPYGFRTSHLSRTVCSKQVERVFHDALSKGLSFPP